MSTIASAPPVKAFSEKEIISGLQGTISASRLQLFLSCRLKFYFRYVLGLVKPKTIALHVGSTVHAVLSTWNKARWIQKPLSLKQVHEVFDQHWKEGQAQEPVEFEGEEDHEKLTAWRLVDTYLRETPIPLNTKPDAVEVPVEADLAKHGLPKLVGILDLVQQKKIIDYKTTSTTPNPEKAPHTHEVQTSSYAILYREASGNTEQGIELHHLVKLKNPKLVITAIPPMSDQQQTRLFRLMESYIDGLDRQDFVPSPGLACFSCDFFN